MRWLICLLLTFLTYSALYSQTVERGGAVTNTKNSSGKTFAIIIGVSDYANLTPEQQLNFADSDAVMIKNYFDSWENIEFKFFLNENASPRDRIGMEIEKTLLKEAKSGDKVILFFAGHGDLDEVYGDGYLLLNQVKPPNDDSYKWNDALSLNSLKQSIDKADLNGVEVFLIADACHSGAVLNSAANSMMSGINENSVTMISCKKGQVSIENKDLGHGVFTYHLIQGLKGLADTNEDKIVSLVELETHVRDQVRIETTGSQQPEFKGNDENLEIAKVDAKLLEQAKKEQKSAQPVLASAKNTKRAFSANTSELSDECLALLRLLEEQTQANKFFADEVDSVDHAVLAIEKALSKKNHANSVNAISVSHDGEHMASASEDGIAVYSNSDLKKPIWLKSHTATVTSLDYSPSGDLLASGSLDKTVIVWNAADGQKNSVFSDLSEEVSSVKFIDDDLVAIGTIKGKVFFWDPQSSKGTSSKMVKGKVNDMEVNYPLLYAAGDDGQIAVYDLELKKKTGSFAAHTEAVTGLRYLPTTNSLLSIGNEGKLKKWHVRDNSMVKELYLEFTELKDLDVDPLGMYCFVGSKQKKVAVIDLSTLKIIKASTSGTSGITCLEYDNQKNTLNIGELDGSVTTQSIKVYPPNSSVMGVRERLYDCSDMSAFKNDIDGDILIELNVSVSKTLNDLVNNAATLPDIKQIRKAQRYAEKALEIGTDLDYDVQNLEINKLLLEVYIILLNNDTLNFKNGITKLDRIQELDPKGAYVYNVSAQLYAKMKDMTKAKEMAEKAEELAPKWSEATNNHGKILVMAGDLKGAETKFKEAISESPKLSKGYASLGELYYYQGKYDDAKVNFEKALKIDSNVAMYRKLYNETVQNIGNQKTKNLTSSSSSSTGGFSLGTLYDGGLIIYVDETGKHGYVCAPINLGKQTWADAKKICDNLTEGGHTDWRLPKLDEMKKCAKLGNQLNGFEYAPFWTASEADTQNAWWIRLLDGVTEKTLKTNVRFVLAVRQF